jgi:hypothetical protein
MTKDEALDLALEALEKTGNIAGAAHDREQAAITAIKQARALDKKAENARELGLDYEPVQEPVAWRFTGIDGFKRFVTDDQHKGFSPEVRAWYEPFKCASCTTPPAAQRQWVSLTDEERVDLWKATETDNRMVLIDATEAKLKEKNT